MADIEADLTLRQLRAIVTVADLGSVSAAARALGLSQPTVSQHLARAEVLVGAPLFARRRRGVLPTGAGLALVRSARVALDAGEDALEAARRVASGGSRELTVGILSSMATSVLPAAAARWRQRHPTVRLRVREELRRSDLDDALRRELVDVAVGTAPDSPQAVVEPAGEERLVLVATPRRRASLGRTVAIGALRDDDWVLYDDEHGLHRVIASRCADAGFRPRATIRTRQVDTAVRLAAAGLGVAVAPVPSIPSELTGLAVPFRPGLRSPVAVYALDPAAADDVRRLAAVITDALP